MVDDTLAGDRVAIDRPRLHRRLLASQYLRNNVLLFAAAMLAGFCNYLMHPLMLRLLGVERYGAVISIMTLTGVLAIPIPVIALVVTRSASTLSAVGNLAQLNDLMPKPTTSPWCAMASSCDLGMAVALMPMRLSPWATRCTARCHATSDARRGDQGHE